MADDDLGRAKKPKTSAAEDNTRGIGIVGLAVILMTAVLLLLVSTYAVSFLLIGMLPALIARILDRRTGSCASRTIGAFNFMGMAPSLFRILESPERAATAKQIVNTPTEWVFIYCTAMLGWLTIWIVPQFTSAIFNIRAQKRVEKIARVQRKLEEDWSYKVAEDVRYDDD